MTAREECRVYLPRIVGKARPRVTKSGHAYTPAETRRAEAAVRAAWLSQVGPARTGWGGEFGIEVTCYQELPKSAPTRREGEPFASKPDADNVLKLVLDALGPHGSRRRGDFVPGCAFADDARCTSAKVVKAPRTPHGSGAWLDIVVRY